MEERRNRNRDSFQQELAGQITVHADGYPVELCEVQDVSPFGLGLLTDSAIRNGHVVSLRYRQGATDIEVFGTVIWSLPAAPEAGRSCAMGIFLDENHAAENVEFFNAISA